VGYLTLQATMLRGVAPVDGAHILGEPAQVIAQTRHRVVWPLAGGALRSVSVPVGRWQKLHTWERLRIEILDIVRKARRIHWHLSHRKPRPVPGQFARRPRNDLSVPQSMAARPMPESAGRRDAAGEHGDRQ